MCTPTQTWHTHLYEYDYLWKRYNGTVGCPLKGSASLMRCAAVWVCGCVGVCICVAFIQTCVRAWEHFSLNGPLWCEVTPRFGVFWRGAAPTGGDGPRRFSLVLCGPVCWVRSPPGTGERQERVGLAEFREWGWAAKLCFISSSITPQGYFVSAMSLLSFPAPVTYSQLFNAREREVRAREEESFQGRRSVWRWDQWISTGVFQRV